MTFPVLFSLSVCVSTHTHTPKRRLESTRLRWNGSHRAGGEDPHSVIIWASTTWGRNLKRWLVNLSRWAYDVITCHKRGHSAAAKYAALPPHFYISIFLHRRNLWAQYSNCLFSLASPRVASSWHGKNSVVKRLLLATLVTFVIKSDFSRGAYLAKTDRQTDRFVIFCLSFFVSVILSFVFYAPSRSKMRMIWLLSLSLYAFFLDYTVIKSWNSSSSGAGQPGHKQRRKKFEFFKF